jgi:hypothetical protein
MTISAKSTLTLRVLGVPLAICRLGPEAEIPAWAIASPFVSITRTEGELSIVVGQDCIPDGINAETGWRCLSVEGPLDFALIGILAALTEPLAAAGVSLFAISTFDTDHILVRQAVLGRAIAALTGAGHAVRTR